jgi:RNA polymerase sigma factor (sigma-70 family)
MSDVPPSLKIAPPPACWESWVASEGEVFFLYARQKTRSESDAKDILQDALTEAWRKTKGVIPDKALVFKTIQRRAIDLGRSMDRRSKRENNFEGVKAHWFSPDYTVGDTRQHLAEAVQKLPGNLREVLVLRIWGDLSFPEIAELNRIPLATANSRYRYALERLRENEKLNELRP